MKSDFKKAVLGFPQANYKLNIAKVHPLSLTTEDYRRPAPPKSALGGRRLGKPVVRDLFIHPRRGG